MGAVVRCGESGTIPTKLGEFSWNWPHIESANELEKRKRENGMAHDLFSIASTGKQVLKMCMRNTCYLFAFLIAWDHGSYNVHIHLNFHINHKYLALH